METVSCGRGRATRNSVLAAFLTAFSLGACAAQPAGPAGRGDITIDGKGVHPESLASSADGSVFIGSITGTIYRAGPRATVARPFITPDAANGLSATFGVLADDAGGRLWVCSVANPFGPRGSGPPRPSEVAAFDLKTGALVGRWPFPAPGGTCNDIAIGPDGAAYATDTPGGRILKLPKGGSALEVVASHQDLRGIDGIAFAADGKMYINNVQRHELRRVELTPDPAAPKLTLLEVVGTLNGPDGLRPIGGNRFLQAESGGGRITLVTIEGNKATITPIGEKHKSTPGVALVGDTIYTAEGKIDMLTSGQDPGVFTAIAIPMPR